jgi:NAD kinase
MNLNSLDYVRFIMDELFTPPLQTLFFVLAAIVVGVYIARRFISYMESGVVVSIEEHEKPKHEPTSFFEQPQEEPDYMVGIGDDGELLFASEQPKRKNDEVD